MVVSEMDGETSMFNERRQHERIECYMIVRQPHSVLEEEDFFGIARNVSTWGAMVETDAEVTAGQTVELAFMLDEGRVWETRGSVVWSRRAANRTVLGLKFLQPLEENWRKLLD